MESLRGKERSCGSAERLSPVPLDDAGPGRGRLSKELPEPRLLEDLGPVDATLPSELGEGLLLAGNGVSTNVVSDRPATLGGTHPVGTFKLKQRGVIPSEPGVRLQVR